MIKITEEDIKAGFAKRFALALKRAGVDGSIQAKADKLDVSKSFMAAMMKGEKLPAREKSLRIAAICGVRESWLMAGELPMVASVTPRIPIEHWDEKDQETLLRLWESMNNKYKTD